ncbi:MAG: GNAT family N-acetyltransferase [Chitinophagales bacterium]
MEILQIDDSHKGKFYIKHNCAEVAAMTYVWAGTNRIIIDHTEVSDALKGMGAGKQMLMKAVAFAREKQLKIFPLCPFAKSVFEKTAAIQDVL